MSGRLIVSPEPLVLMGLEVCTPLGWSSDVTCAEIAACTLAYRETDDGEVEGDPVVACRWQAIPCAALHTDRMVSLATTAFGEHLRALVPQYSKQLGTIPVVLALGSGYGDERNDDPSDVVVVVDCLKDLAATLAPDVPLVFGNESFTGRAAYLSALGRAIELISRGDCSAVIVGGVDSLCDPVSLEHLAADNRLQSANNRDGLIPAEAAGFGLLLPERLVPSSKQGGLRISGISLAKEPCPFQQQQEPSVAEGLTVALAQLYEHPQIQPRATGGVFSCQSAETYWAEELAQACLRNSAAMPEPLRVYVLGSTLGDVGAASAAVQLAVAESSMRRRAVGDEVTAQALVYACADDGVCAACVVTPRAGTAGALPEDGRTCLEQVVHTLGHTHVDSEMARAQLRERVELHHGELGFLLTQRQVVLNDASRAWTDASAIEARVSCHQDALRAWGRDVYGLTVESGLASADPENLLGAVFSLAALTQSESEWSELRRVLMSASAQKLAPWEQALLWTTTGDIGSKLGALVCCEAPAVVALAARVMAYRQEGDGVALRERLAAFDTLDTASRSALCAALAALNYREAKGELTRVARGFAHESTALCGLHLLGDRSALGRMRVLLEHRDTALAEHLLVLALAGSEADASLLLRAESSADSVALEVARCHALGTCGAPSLVEPLIERLEHSERDVVVAAQLALHRISGVQLSGRCVPPPFAVVPGTFYGGRDESASDDRGGPATLDARSWRSWWREHGRELQQYPRVRLGAPFTLKACLDEAWANTSCKCQRQLAMDELHMRLGVRAPLRSDAFVAVQQRALNTYRS